jgi:hypothetical protein
MIDYESTTIDALTVHHIGNPVQEEGIVTSDTTIHPDDVLAPLLLKYFTMPFKAPEYYQFYHESGLSHNPLYTSVQKIFTAPDQLHLESLNIAAHLYSVSEHPNIKAGELYVAYLSDCSVGGEVCDAVGIFKSENKETYLKVFSDNGGFGLEQQEGININRLDKGCIVFNVDASDGYKALSIDNTNKGTLAQYWNGQFLGMRKREDTYYHTQNYLHLCRDFAREALPEADRLDQLSLVSESSRYFAEKEAFDKVSFEEQVLREPELIQAFEDYRQSYQNDHQIRVVDEFDIDSTAVKKLKRVFKSVLKLDKNFHIYVHGNRDLIRKGFDAESGLNYYQVFYREES